MMAWLRRIGLWVVIVLSVVVPGLGWWRERQARRLAERRWQDEVARGFRLAELERDRRRMEAERHAREAKVRTETEKAAVAHETRAADARALEDDLDALAGELDRTAR
jgi:hypothetical protein